MKCSSVHKGSWVIKGKLASSIGGSYLIFLEKEKILFHIKVAFYKSGIQVPSVLAQIMLTPVKLQVWLFSQPPFTLMFHL